MKTRIFEDLVAHYQLWRDTCLGKNNSQAEEVAFIEDVFGSARMPIRTVIDLGGGIGIHSIPLCRKGYELVLYDQSIAALRIAARLEPSLRIVEGRFEAIQCEEMFDAALCMWSSLSYVSDQKERLRFYSWMGLHVKDIIVLDQPNFARYPLNSKRVYEGENGTHRMQVTREWRITGKCKETNYTYRISDKISGNEEFIYDQEEQHYLSVTEIQSMLGAKWRLSTVYGDYSTKIHFDSQSSPRMIAIFQRTETPQH